MTLFRNTSPTKLSECKRIAIMRLSALGDIFNLVPILHLICKNYPNLEVTWIIGKNESHLFQHFAQKYPNLKLYVFNKAVPYSQAIKQMRELTDTPFDILFQAQTSLRSNILVKFIKAKVKIGFCPKRAFNLQRFFINKQIPNQTSMHVMFDYWDLFSSYLSGHDHQQFFDLGIVDSKAIYFHNYPKSLQSQLALQPLFDLGLGSPGSTQALGFIQAQNLDLYKLLLRRSRFERVKLVDDDLDQPKLVIVSPASSALHKNWTSEGYATIIHDILSQDHYCIVTGSSKPEELAVVNAALEYYEQHFKYRLTDIQQNKLIVLANKTNLLELVLFIELADLVISPDSGPMHLASCLGIPTIGLFAYLNPYRSGPIQGLADVISTFHQNYYGEPFTPNREFYQKDLDNWGSHPKKPDLMSKIPIDLVQAKVRQILERLETSPISKN